MTENPDPGAATAPPYRFGVAAELDRAQKAPARNRPDAPPPDGTRYHPLDHRVWQCRARARRGPIRGRTLSHLRFWWASCDRRPGDMWHRLRCRRGHHEIRGGQQMQLGSKFVHVERCCVWCGAKPPPLPGSVGFGGGRF